MEKVYCMTGENLILGSIKTQFSASFGGTMVDEFSEFPGTPGAAVPSAARVRLGKNNRNQINSLAAITDLQYCEVFIDLQTKNTSAQWSSTMEFIYLFTQGIYVPPVPAAGDLIQIDSLDLLYVDPPNYSAGGSHQGIRRGYLICKYHHF